MKETQKSNETEPTIKDVMGVVQDLAVSVQDLTVAVQEGFAKVEARLDQHESIIKTIVIGQDNLLERMNVIDQKLTKTQTRVEDVVDDNQATLLDHGRRIAILEKVPA